MAQRKRKGLLYMQNYNEIKKIMENLDQQYSKLLMDERVSFSSALNAQKKSGLKGLMAKMNLRKRMQEKAKMTQIHSEMKNISALETAIFNVQNIADILLYRLFQTENKKITKSSYNNKLKEYQFISEKLEMILKQKEKIQTGNDMEHSIIIADAVLTFLTNLLSKAYNFQTVSEEPCIDEEEDKRKKDMILYDSRLYESVKDYHNLEEILEKCIELGYSYASYSKLIDAYLVFNNESLSEETKQNEELKKNDFYVIRNQANNDSTLSLYSKKQLIATSKMLLEEMEKRENAKDLKALVNITNHLSRRK